MSDKILATHRERTAIVYVRQSSLHQVRHHLESQRRQYELAELARSHGFRTVEVIDEDLGRSGSGSEQRPGFSRLLAAVCAGEVGAVLALEASRLARNNRDWHHLIDLCAMTAALVIDHDGIYDPSRLNDRLLLGLKGTMSEFELSLLRQRAQEALRQKIHRGEVLWMAPVGYVRTDDNRMEMTPDRQVQDAVRGVFAKFVELGSARQVLLWYRQQQLSLPTLATDRRGESIIWQLPGYRRILSILKNPAYAGAFVVGRRRTRTVMVEGRARKTAGHEVPRDQWELVIQGHHPEYISWEQYLRNQAAIGSNASMRGRMADGHRGAPKSGPALLAGLLRCARCGRRLHVGYSGVGGVVPRYFCRGAHLNHGTAWCISIGGLRIDAAVVEAVLEAVQPVGVEAALDAWRQMQAGESREQRSLELALEKARFEADRQRRQYDAVEPENRLVAAELESRWNAALGQAHQLQLRLDAAQRDARPVSESQRARLLDLGHDLSLAWSHPTASPTLKKRILRTVLREIVIDVLHDPPQATMMLHWTGGVHTELVVERNRTGRHRHTSDRDVVELTRDLALTSNDMSIAAILNRLGYRTGRENTWTESRVRSLRAHHGIAAAPKPEERQWLTLAQTAAQLGTSVGFVRGLMRQRLLPARQTVAQAPWIIDRADLELPAVTGAVKNLRQGLRRPRLENHPSQTALFPER